MILSIGMLEFSYYGAPNLRAIQSTIIEASDSVKSRVFQVKKQFSLHRISY